MVGSETLSVSEKLITCPNCGELQSSDNLRCARCGIALETKEQRKVRLTALEESRREAERRDVSIQRLPGFGTNGTNASKFGTREYFGQMSNQMRRRYIIALGGIFVYFIFILTR